MRTRSFICAALLAVAALGWSQDKPAPTGKVAYVDIDRITAKAKAVSNLMIDVEEQVKGFQRDIDARRKKVTELDAEVRRNEGIVSKDVQEQKKKEIDKLKNELEELEFKAQRKMKEVDSSVFEPMMKKILFAIQDVAKEKGFDIVLRGEAVLYGSSSVDITDDVIKRLNTTADSSTTGTQAKAAEKKEPEKKEAPAQTFSEPKSESTPAAAPAAKSDAKPAAKSSTKAKDKSARPVDRQPE